MNKFKFSFLNKLIKIIENPIDRIKAINAKMYADILIIGF